MRFKHLLFATTRALEPVSFMASQLCPRWLFQHNNSNLCPNLLIRRAQQVPTNYMPHQAANCWTPYCQVLVRLTGILGRLETAVHADVLDWTICEGLVIDCLEDSRTYYFTFSDNSLDSR